MNILAIGLDPLLLDPASVSMKRQHAYYRGHNATILVLRKGSAVQWKEGSIRTVCFGGNGKPQVLFRAAGSLFAEKKKYDLVIAQDVLWSGLLAYFVTRIHGGKLITQLHGDYLDNPKWIGEKRVNSLMNAVGKFILQKSDYVRCVSKKIQDQITTSLAYPKERTTSIPIGTDLTLFTAEGLSAATPERFVIFAQRLIPEKSPMHYVTIMIDLMGKYPDLHAVIAGEGSLKKEMGKAFADAGVTSRVHFLGHIGLAQLAMYYRKAVCLLHTAGWEGWGMPMIEAMACGAPVVTTDTGCAGEVVINGRNGYVLPIDDVEGMKAKTELLLTNSALRAEFSANAKKDAQAWSFVTLSSKLHDWYESAYDNRK